ncbi:MAG: alpha/beta hydrolase [Saccharofermentanales bacterium]
MKFKFRKVIKTVLIVFTILLVLIIGGFYIYTLDYYKADDNALKLIASDPLRIKVSGNMTVFYPGKQNDSETGVIFYPGGKVESSAYAPLLEKLSQEGVTCVLIKMPFNLAVFDINAADKIYAGFPDIRNWYIGGHSLGGAMASSYVAKNRDRLKGLILLAAYPVNDSDIPTLVLYGSEDQVLDRSKLKGIGSVVEIAGGNHAYFGDYGEQKGDGIAKITRSEQQKQAADNIMEFIGDSGTVGWVKTQGVGKTSQDKA